MTDPQMLALRIQELERQLAVATLAYEELCKDVAEWHPMCECAPLRQFVQDCAGLPAAALVERAKELLPMQEPPL